MCIDIYLWQISQFWKVKPLARWFLEKSHFFPLYNPALISQYILIYPQIYIIYNHFEYILQRWRQSISENAGIIRNVCRQTFTVCDEKKHQNMLRRLRHSFYDFNLHPSKRVRIIEALALRSFTAQTETTCFQWRPTKKFNKIMELMFW